MLMHTLKFNVSACGIDQSTQTARHGIHGLLEEVAWDIVDDILNPCFQLFQCARFCPPHKKKSHGVRSGLLVGHT
ncbi:hypothetical protein C0J52_01536 [Blattella germanica]|nr:hypothetical protein C0J52_01536 [Blattella germanica]